MLFLFHPSHPPCIVYYLVSSIYETHFPPPPPLPFVFLVIPAHLYFVSVRMSGIVRETQEEARFFFIYYFFFLSCTLVLFGCLIVFFFFFLQRSIPCSRFVLLISCFLVVLETKREGTTSGCNAVILSDNTLQLITLIL